jgi:starch-binding outer membrane protein, SusD/RagB family
MKIKINLSLLGMMITIVFFVLSCNLDEQIPDKYTQSVMTSDPNLLVNLVAPPVAQLRELWLRENYWGQQEATSDELYFPTRGTDWLDGGVWQQDYLLTWTPSHRDVGQTWNTLNTAISTAKTALFNLGKESPSDPALVKSYRAQAKFLRTYYEYCMYDLYRKFPFRDPFDFDFTVPSKVFGGTDAFYHMVTIAKDQLDKIITRDEALYGQPNRDAVLMLLAKLYLNEQVYTGTSGYDSCLIYLNELIGTGHYGLSTNYFNMFAVNNDQNYKKPNDEAIFVAVYDDGDNYGLDNRVVWITPTLHYNMTLSGPANYPRNSFWNGCAVPPDFIQKEWIEGTDFHKDVRWADSTYIKTMAIPAGNIAGQQFDINGDSIFDRTGLPLNFTQRCSLVLSDSFEVQGIRVVKYMMRPVPVNIMRTPNDFLIWRYADALLMQAECLVRQNSDVNGALTIVNQIRTQRKAPIIASAASTQDMLDKILVERGLELYWEGHRRQDMIRFGTFLLAKSSKPNISPETNKILPVPQSAIDGSGGTITQNPGY